MEKAALDDYTTYLRLERGLSENSITSYAYDAKAFIAYIEEYNPQLSPENCSKQDTQTYVYQLAKQVNAFAGATDFRFEKLLIF